MMSSKFGRPLKASSCDHVCVRMHAGPACQYVSACARADSLPHIVMAFRNMAFIVMSYIVIACLVMGCIVKAFYSYDRIGVYHFPRIVVTFIVMGCTVMAY